MTVELGERDVKFNLRVVADRLTRGRLGSYLNAADGNIRAAIELYDWNAMVGASFLEDLGRLEVVFRNAVDDALTAYGAAQGWPEVWYRRHQLFRGEHGPQARTWANIEIARQRAAGQRDRQEEPGKVIAELSFGFWRFLCTKSYLTSLWVPAVAAAFPQHPSSGNPRQVRADVEGRMRRLYFLRNRIAHHEPVHRRNLARDHAETLELIGWICPDCRAWAEAVSRTPGIIGARPVS